MATTSLVRHSGFPTMKDARNALTKLDHLKKKYAEMKVHGHRVTQHVIRTAEVSGTAFLAGMVQGRTGGIELFGFPVELLAGLGLTAFSLVGGAGDLSHHLAAVGDGALAAYSTTLGRGMGAASKAALAPAPAPAPTAAVTKGSHLTPEEVAAIAEG